MKALGGGLGAKGGHAAICRKESAQNVSLELHKALETEAEKC